MILIMSTLEHPVSQRLGWSLIHLLWQGAVVAMFSAGLLWLLRRRSANARYAAAYGALLLLPALLMVTFVILLHKADWLAGKFRSEPHNAEIKKVVAANGDQAKLSHSKNDSASWPPDASEMTPVDSRQDPHPSERQSFVVKINKKPLTEKKGVASTGADLAHEPIGPENAGQSLPNTLRDRIATTIQPALSWIVAGWIVGLFVLSLWHLRGWIGLRRLRRRGVSPVPESLLKMLHRLCERFGIRRSVVLLQSSRVTVPSLLGFVKPVILLPGSVLTGLTPVQLEAVLAHELAHVRRHDYLLNLLQTGVETLLFFHPAVWWMSRRIRIERENCCDDLALSVTNDRLLYAQSLTRLEELRQQAAASWPAALTVAASGGSLLDRICRVLGKPRRDTTRSHIKSVAATGLSGLLSIAAVLLLLLPGMMSQVSPVTQAAAPEQATPSNPATVISPKSTGSVASNETVLASRPTAKAVKALPAKPIDLGKDNFNVEVNPVNKVQGGLYAIGSYRVAGQAPDAKSLYGWRLNKKAPDGNLQFVGRVSHHVPAGTAFRVLSFSRSGTKITAKIDYEFPGAVTTLGLQSVYFRGWLPKDRERSTLPPGKYDVEVVFEYRKGRPAIYTQRIKKSICRFVVPALGISVELKKLATAAIAIQPKQQFHQPRGSDQSPIGLDLSRILKLTGQDRDRAKFPRAHQNFAVGVHELVKAKKTWALCSLLDHPNVDARILAADGLGKLGDPDSVPVLLAAAKNNNYFVSGSENATLHGIYRSSLVLALQKITGLTLTARKMKNRFDLLSGQPNFKIVDEWLKVVYLADSTASNRPRTGRTVVLKQIKTPKDRGTLHDAYEKVRTGKHSNRDCMIVVPGPMPKDQTLSSWFNSRIKADCDLTTDDELWLLFRSRAFSIYDFEWIERVERKGNDITVTARRAFYLGALYRNAPHHNVFGLNLGKLPAGNYTVKWIIRESHFTKFDKNRWPKDEKFAKPLELKTSVNVLSTRNGNLEKIKKAGAVYLAKNKTKKGVVTTKSGLQYKIRKAGTGRSPKRTDTVKIRFSGTLTDGNRFAASRTCTVRVTDPDNPNVIKGWTEALQLMKVGAKWKLFIPPDLGWGEHALPSNVGPYAVLLFEVELLEIVKKTKTDMDAAVAAIKRLRGRVTFDTKSPGKPVTGVRLFGPHVIDANLVYLRDLTNLWALDLTNTKITDVGLKHLKALRNLQTPIRQKQRAISVKPKNRHTVDTYRNGTEIM